jgi:hypothetical protein
VGVGWWAAIFFVIFILFSAVVLMSLVIGVIMTRYGGMMGCYLQKSIIFVSTYIASHLELTPFPPLLV